MTTTSDQGQDEGYIYLRLSDFRDEDDGMTWEARAAELLEFAARIGADVPEANVRIENDLNGGGKTKGASAYKTPRKVKTPSGLITFRTNRPVFERTVLDLQAAGPRRKVLIVGDDTRITRDERDGLDLIDAARVSGCRVVAPDEDDEPNVMLDGGDQAKIDRFRDRISDARKFSADIGRKVRKGRRRWAGKSYQGGQRPYGYDVDPDTAEHQRKLIVNEAEAAVIRQAAKNILGLGISLKAIARDLRERDEPTVQGGAWSAKTLREVLIKPAVAGLTPKGRPPAKGQPDERPLIRGPWEPILDESTWRRLRDKLTDPDRRTNTGNANEPRWLLSGFATCGVCEGRLRVGGGRDRAPAYIGSECCHVRRNAEAVDRRIGELVIRRLSQPDAAGLLKPPPRPDVDTAGLRAELRKIGQGEAAIMRLVGEDPDREAAARRELARLAADRARINVQLAASDEPDPLPEFREGRPAEAVWAELGIARRRAVVQTLIESIVVKPTGRRGAGFDPGSLDVTPAA
jgi:hypothetical protein